MLKRTGSVVWDTKYMTKGTTTNGKARRDAPITRDDVIENAAMNVTRYKKSGITQSRGTAAMSVDRYVVTPSMRLEGAADNVTHLSRRDHDNAGTAYASPRTATAAAYPSGSIAAMAGRAVTAGVSL